MQNGEELYWQLLGRGLYTIILEDGGNSSGSLDMSMIGFEQGSLAMQLTELRRPSSSTPFAQVFIYHRLGWGNSPPIDSLRAISAAETADRLHNLLIQNGIKGARILIGHPRYTREFAQRFPAGIMGVVAINNKAQEQSVATEYLTTPEVEPKDGWCCCSGSSNIAETSGISKIPSVPKINPADCEALGKAEQDLETPLFDIPVINVADGSWHEVLKSVSDLVSTLELGYSGRVGSKQRQERIPLIAAAAPDSGTLSPPGIYFSQDSTLLTQAADAQFSDRSSSVMPHSTSSGSGGSDVSSTRSSVTS